MGVDTVSNEVKAMLDDSREVADIYRGGKHLRELAIGLSGTVTSGSGGTVIVNGVPMSKYTGNNYLPKFPMEDDESYRARVQCSWLFNGVEKTISDMEGKLFSRPVTVPEDDNDQRLIDICANANLEGDDLNAVAKQLFRKGMVRGLSFLMVDAPRRPDGELSRGEVEAMGLRPYMMTIGLGDVLGWTWEHVNNMPVLTSFRIMETAPKEGRDKWSDEVAPQIRAYELIDGFVEVSLWQGSGGDGPKSSAYKEIERYRTQQTRIMAVPYYTGKTGYMKARSPLYEMAELNMAWFRSNSDQQNIMHHARAPMKEFRGYSMEDMQNLAEGAGYAFSNSNPDSSVNVVEHSGSAIGAGRQEGLDLITQMQSMGMQFVVSKTGNNTATGDSIDERNQNSRLSVWADNLKDTLEIALTMVSDLAGIKQEPIVVVNSEFSAMGHLSMDQVRDMYNAGVISQATYITEAKRRGVLDEGVDAGDEKDAILEEAGEVLRGDIPVEDA